MSHGYDPAKQPCSPLWHTECCPGAMCPAGPGGNTTLIENNEKGILETGLFEVISTTQYAELGSDHDSNKQGIYTTNSVGDRD